MAIKYFLDDAPDDLVIDKSSLTKFRKMRLKDSDILNKLIRKSVEIALESGVIKSRTAIVDSTHTGSRYNSKTPTENILDVAKKARKALYAVSPEAKERMPQKPADNEFESALSYAGEVAKAIENEAASEIPAVKKNLEVLKEVVTDDWEKLQNAQSFHDEDAKTGHKSADTTYFGYKTHLAVTRNGSLLRPQ